MKTVAERLKYAREILREWSQGELAVKAGLTPAAVSNIERGIRKAKGSLPQLADALRVNHAWLAKGEGEIEMDVNNPPTQAANDPPAVVGMGDSLAFLFDSLPRNDHALRSRVYREASKPILLALGQSLDDLPTTTPASAPETQDGEHQTPTDHRR